MYLNMFKALTAAAAITICCLGNEFPAKAELSPSQRYELEQIKHELWAQRMQQINREAEGYFLHREQRQNEILRGLGW